MRLKSCLLGMLAVVTSTPAGAETVRWEARASAGPGWQIVGGGEKNYTPATDVVTRENAPGRDGSVSWSKSLALDDTLAISASIHRAPIVDGFGLVVVRKGDRDGFSWEWFDCQDGDVFVKRQGGERIRVTTTKGPGYEELASVEFLEDTTLRYLDSMEKPPGTHTHEVIVRQGSVLRFSP